MKAIFFYLCSFRGSCILQFRTGCISSKWEGNFSVRFSFLLKNVFTMSTNQPPLSAAAANLFHVNSRFSSNSAAIASFSANFFSHCSKSSVSISKNIFRTFTVNPLIAWFQWDLIFFSSASNMMGKITLRFWEIRATMCSLFHKKRVRSATCKEKALCFYNFQMQVLPNKRNNKRSGRIDAKDFLWFSYYCKIEIFLEPL